MKDQNKNYAEPEEVFSDALKSVVQKIEVNPGFKAELGEQLAEAHQHDRSSLGQSAFNRAMPAFSWMLALALMALVLNWVFRSIAPPPIPAAQETSISSRQETPSPIPTEFTTPAPEDEGYDWSDTKLYLAQSLPQSPEKAHVYLKKITEQATREDVLALARRFQINGEIQEVPGDIPGETNYRISDGRERLEVRSDRYFTYHSNFGEQLYLDNLSEEQARIIADNFLKKNSFDFEYKIERSPEMLGTQFYILPLTPDGYEMRFDYMQPVRYQILLDNSGENIIFTGYSVEYESVGTFGIIKVEEALQKIIDPNPQSGLMEIFRGQGGGGGGSSFHKLNLSGTPVPFPRPTAQPHTNEGTVEYVVQEGDTVLAIAQEYGTTPEKIVQANSWLSDGHVLTPGETLIITGAQSQNQNPYIGKRLDNQRGIFLLNIYKKPDGSQRTEYAFVTAQDGENFNLKLVGDGLQDLEKYNNLPINIWATIESVDQFGMMTARVDQFAIPFPDLRIQIFQGQQKLTQINGQSAILFTTDDEKTYIQAILNGDPFVDNLLIGVEGDEVLLEAINIPDDTYNGYPVLRVFSASMVTNPKNDQATEMTVTADQPYIMDEIPVNETFIPPTATIEKVELVYYILDPRYAPPDSNSKPQYLQPAWRFYGHYSNGDEFEFLIQALREEYLLPELAPYTPPG